MIKQKSVLQNIANCRSYDQISLEKSQFLSIRQIFDGLLVSHNSNILQYFDKRIEQDHQW